MGCFHCYFYIVSIWERDCHHKSDEVTAVDKTGQSFDPVKFSASGEKKGQFIDRFCQISLLAAG
jgi:hypothetical protein